MKTDPLLGMERMLDTRPRRRDLTSRECCSLFGSLLGALLQLHPRPVVEKAMRVVAAMTLEEGEARRAALEQAAAMTDVDDKAAGDCVVLVAAQLAGLDENALPGAAALGLRWWIAHPEAWVVKPPTDAAPS